MQNDTSVNVKKKFIFVNGEKLDCCVCTALQRRERVRELEREKERERGRRGEWRDNPEGS